MIITETPYRISLFGGGTDHPAWYRENGGEVISFTIDKYCHLITKANLGQLDHKYQISYSISERTNELDAIKHPLVREAIRRYCPSFPLQLIHDSDLPARSGVGSSSAFAVGMIHSLSILMKMEMSKDDLANEAIFLEQEILKENVGSQDQIACAIGGINYITFGNNPFWHAETLKLNPEEIAEIERRMVLVYSGVARSSSNIQSGLVNNLKSSQREMYRNIDLARECRKILTGGGNLDDIGEMLIENWYLKKELNPLSVTERLQEVWEHGLKAGALGGKVLGAGGGGFCLFWVKDGRKSEFLSRFNAGVDVPIKISFGGSTCILQD
jgi:D-glycero-alpha-D-manno-heptose-7-phosphate kinase